MSPTWQRTSSVPPKSLTNLRSPNTKSYTSHLNFNFAQSGFCHTTTLTTSNFSKEDKQKEEQLVKNVKPKENINRKKLSITATVSSRSHCPTFIIEAGRACRVSGSKPHKQRKMSKNSFRRQTKLATDCRKTCSETIAKTGSSFGCFICGCRIHLTKQFTYFNEGAIKGLIASGKRPLVCSACVNDKQPDKFIKESETKSQQSHELQKIEKEMAGLALSLKWKLSWYETNSQNRRSLRSLKLQYGPPVSNKPWAELESKELPNPRKMMLAAVKSTTSIKFKKSRNLPPLKQQ